MAVAMRIQVPPSAPPKPLIINVIVDSAFTMGQIRDSVQALLKGLAIPDRNRDCNSPLLCVRPD